MKIAGLAIFCALIGVAGSASANDFYRACTDGRIDAKGILDTWYKAGVVQSFSQREGSGELYVNTGRWERVGNKVQVSVGLAAYCFVSDRIGRGVVIVSGSRQEKLGSVVNGNWSSGS